MIDTEDLTSYYPGYDEYCEPRENQGTRKDFDIDYIIDERRLQEMEEKESKLTKEIVLFNVVYKQGEKTEYLTYALIIMNFLERICKEDKSTFIAIKQTIYKSLENIENKARRIRNGKTK